MKFNQSALHYPNKQDLITGTGSGLGLVLTRKRYINMKQIFYWCFFIVMAGKLNAQVPLQNKTELLENKVLLASQSFDYDNYQPINLHLQQSQRTKKASKFLMKASAVLLVVGFSSLIYANTFPEDPANGFYLLPGPQTGFQLLGILGIGGSIGTGIPGILLYRKELRKQKTK